MKVLALEPYWGGSHQAFFCGWQAHSRHQFDLFRLPAHHWKWRMRHAAIEFARLVQCRPPAGDDAPYDLVWASDMLNLAEFRGLAKSLLSVPAVLYFHENQFTYPQRFELPLPQRSDLSRDEHFGFTNLISSIAADAVWFNSDFHRDDFLAAAASHGRRMPDYQPHEWVDAVRAKSAVFWPGIERARFLRPRCMSRRGAHPLRIAWVGRWEHDKNPEDFFSALRALRQRAMPFELVMLGQSFDQVPAEFHASRREFADQTVHWGFASPSRYAELLQAADVIASTARHEFFGMAVMEAMAAGAMPVLPNRLSYPAVLRAMELPVERFSYAGSVKSLASRLVFLGRELTSSAGRERWQRELDAVQGATAAFDWPERASAMDDAVDEIVAAHRR